MNKEITKEILYIIIAILLGILVVKFIIWLLPILLIGICGIYIYKSIKRNKASRNNNDGKKEKRIKIIDMENEK